jgi:hypothetical protein
MMMAAPVMADIVITIDNSVYPALVRYENTGGATQRPRAFALDIMTDGAFDINAVTDLSINYWVHPGGINIVAGEVEQDGNAWADPCDYPDDTEGGIGTIGVTIEMASLYKGEANAPDSNGTLCSFTVTGQCLVSITENTIRGGVVKEDTNSASGDDVLDLSGATDIQVPPGTPPCYEGPDSEWATVGSPNSWCYPSQCYGDVDNLEAGSPKAGYTKVNEDDLAIFMSYWKVFEATKGTGIPLAGYAADVDHAEAGSPKAGYTRVNEDDLAIFMSNWKIFEATKGTGIPVDCNTPGAPR